jgi:hypothetical protein
LKARNSTLTLFLTLIFKVSVGPGGSESAPKGIDGEVECRELKISVDDPHVEDRHDRAVEEVDNGVINLLKEINSRKGADFN